MKNILYALAALPLLLSSCNKDSEAPELSTTAVQFTTAITRASGTTWGGSDKIGVFMKTANGDISTSTTLNAANVLYTNSASGFATATPIYYPEAQAVDFVAYYPHRDTPGTDPYIYKVNVATQTTPADIDLLYSDDAKNKTSATPTVPLHFRHVLSKLVLNVTKGDGMEDVDFSAIGIAIAGMPTKADFSLADGTFANPGTVTDIVPKAVTAGEQYEAIVIPQVAGTAGRSMVFTVGGQSFNYFIAANAAFAEGKTYTYTVTVSKTGVAVSVADVTWTSGGTTDTGTAVLQAAVGDYYYEDGTYSGTLDGAKTCVGIVFRAKTATQNGLVVALEEEDRAWGPTGTDTGATDENNGAANMDKIKGIANWNTNYPAFAYCASYGSGTAFAGQWYLPAKNELRALRTVWNGGTDTMEQNNMRTTFNTKLTAAGATPLNNSYYWSSSEFSSNFAWLVAFVNGSTDYANKSSNVTVRAVLAF